MQAAACPDAPDDAEYAIHHETHGEVGRHGITFACAGDELVVETRITGEVRVLMVPIFQREARYREVWRGDRLIAFDSWFNDNGEVYEVKARAAGEQTIIEGRRGRIEAPSTVVSNHPWNHAVLDRPLLFDTQRRQAAAGAGDARRRGHDQRRRRPTVRALKYRHDRRSRARALVRPRRRLAAVAPRISGRRDHADPAIVFGSRRKVCSASGLARR